MPTLVCCSQLYGAAAGKSAQGQGDPTITLATWNVLSVSKCETSANGFIGMQAEAFAKHNELDTEDCKFVQTAPDKDGKEENVDLCASTWIQDMIPRVMKDHNVDVLFVQEIDYPMLLGLRKLDETDYLHMPITGTAHQGAIETKLMNQKANEAGKPAGDTAYVVWRTGVSVECRKAGKNIPEVLDAKGKSVRKEVDMSKVGLCSIAKGNGDHRNAPGKGEHHNAPGKGEHHNAPGKGDHRISVSVIGMHGDGDVGFTAEQSHVILKEAGGKSELVVDAVLGDLNRGSAREVLDAVYPLNDDLVVPHKGEKTVYRVVHAYRKLVQAVQNSKISAKDAKGEALVVGDVTCASIPENERNDKGEPIPNTHMTKWCADVAAVRASHGKSEEEVAALDAGTKKTLENGKLVKLIQKIAGSNEKLWGKITKETPPYNWKNIAADLGLEEDFRVQSLDEAEKSMKAEVQREDWVAYDHIKFDLVRATVPYDGLLRSVSRSDTGKPSAKAKYPVQEMASDHLPVIMELKAATPSSCGRIVKRAVRKLLKVFGHDGHAES